MSGSVRRRPRKEPVAVSTARGGTTAHGSPRRAPEALSSASRRSRSSLLEIMNDVTPEPLDVDALHDAIAGLLLQLHRKKGPITVTDR